MVRLTYLQMVVMAVNRLKVRGTKGVSRQAIKRYISNSYGKMINANISESTFNKYVSNGINRGVERGILVQNKQSFKLGENGLREYRNIQKINGNILCKMPGARKTIHPKAMVRVRHHIRVNRTTGTRTVVASHIRKF